MKREIKDYLLDILEECDYLLKKAEGLEFGQLLKDEDLKRAVVRSLEVIGEAVKKIPEEFKERFKDVEWKDVAGMRDKLIHEYFGVDYEIVWKTLKEDVPLLKEVVGKILREI